MIPGNNEITRALKRLLPVAALCALVAGCAAGTTGIEAAGKKNWNDEGAPELAKRLEINNSSLAGDIEITDLKLITSSDLHRAQASLRSKSRDTLRIQYRFDWLDADGTRLTADAPWKPLMIYGKDSTLINSVSPDPRGREFRLKIRAPE